MAHALTIRNNGSAEMAYIGETPWHGLGAAMQAGASIEEWQAAAGMDWRIQRAVVRYATARGMSFDDCRSIDDKIVLFRSDNGNHLGVVSDNYKVVQPGAMLEFFRDIADRYGATIETAGTLYEGRRFWALAKMGEGMDIGWGDTVKPYVLICSSADGTLATEVRFVAMRVVCQNTLTIARGEGRADYKVSHRSKFNAREAKQALGLAERDSFDSTMQQFRRLADTRMTDVDMAMKTAEVFAPGAASLAKDELVALLKTKPVTRVMELAVEGQAIGAGLDGMKGTAWGWLTRVTQYIDHEARARSVDNRLNSAWFGKGDGLKQRAYELVTAGGETVSIYQSAPAGGLLDSVLAATVTA